MKLNLGCGNDYKKGYVNVDYKSHSLIKPDVIWNLNKFSYPWDDNSIDEVYFQHCIEHLKEHKRPMEEIYRILKPGGKLILIYPWWNCLNSLSYGHNHIYNQFWINYFCEESKTKTQYSKIRFKKIKEEIVPSNIFRFIPRFIRDPLSNLICNISKEIRWELMK